MKRLYAAALSLFLAAMLTGCTAPTEPAYDPETFSCVLTVDSVRTGEEDYFTLRYRRENGSASMTVTAPETLAGITFTGAGDAWVMTVEQSAIPLSEAVSADLQEMAALLSSVPAEAESCRETEVGTVFCFLVGELTLDVNGLPVMLCTTDGRHAGITAAADIPEA